MVDIYIFFSSQLLYPCWYIIVVNFYLVTVGGGVRTQGFTVITKKGKNLLVLFCIFFQILIFALGSLLSGSALKFGEACLILDFFPQNSDFVQSWEVKDLDQTYLSLDIVAGSHVIAGNNWSTGLVPVDGHDGDGRKTHGQIHHQHFHFFLQ